jgi:hypothetical protein
MELVSVTPDSGDDLDLTPITITGSNLTGAAYGFIGTGTYGIDWVAIAALGSFVVVDDSTITTTVPAISEPGIYSILIHRGSENVVLADAFTVIGLSVSSVTPDNGALLAGGDLVNVPVTITGTALTGISTSEVEFGTGTWGDDWVGFFGVSSLVVVDSETITAVITPLITVPPGVYNMGVYHAARNASLVGAFTVTE